MYVVLAFVLLLVPFAALYVFERLARAGKGPLADPGRMIVLDGTIIPVPTPVLTLVDVPTPETVKLKDNEACVAESRIVAALLAGELDRTQYQERMADLAATDAAIRPVRLPPAGSGT